MGDTTMRHIAPIAATIAASVATLVLTAAVAMADSADRGTGSAMGAAARDALSGDAAALGMMAFGLAGVWLLSRRRDQAGR
jgi:hypothetical protein